jgi:hypothetical protein
MHAQAANGVNRERIPLFFMGHAPPLAGLEPGGDDWFSVIEEPGVRNA